MNNFLIPQLVALFDACVLYPAPLRDLLMHLALTDLFRAKWTETIHQEWIKNVLANWPDLTLSQLQRTRELMDSHVRDCLITEYEHLISVLSLPDLNDRHVLAAAIKAEASRIVTYNLKDFPEKSMHKHGIEARHPDDFISYLIDMAPGTVCIAVQRLRNTLKNPSIEKEKYLEILGKQSLSKTVDKLRVLIS